MPDNQTDRAHVAHEACPRVPLDAAPLMNRIGVAKGQFEIPDTIDAHAEELTRLFKGDAAA